MPNRMNDPNGMKGLDRAISKFSKLIAEQEQGSGGTGADTTIAKRIKTEVRLMKENFQLLLQKIPPDAADAARELLAELSAIEHRIQLLEMEMSRIASRGIPENRDSP